MNRNVTDDGNHEPFFFFPHRGKLSVFASTRVVEVSISVWVRIVEASKLLRWRCVCFVVSLVVSNQKPGSPSSKGIRVDFAVGPELKEPS